MLNSPEPGIYLIRNIKDGKFYVGRAVNLRKRTRRHLAMLRAGVHDNPKLQRAFQKYGEQNFVVETMLICAKENLRMYEQAMLDGLDATILGYNIEKVSGAPMAGRTNTAASNELRSKAMIGRIKSDATCAKLAECQRGRKHSPERIQANRDARQKPDARAATSKRMVGNKNAAGSVRTDQAKANYRASWTPERRAALGELVRARYAKAREGAD